MTNRQLNIKACKIYTAVVLAIIVRLWIPGSAIPTAQNCNPPFSESNGGGQILCL